MNHRVHRPHPRSTSTSWVRCARANHSLQYCSRLQYTRIDIGYQTSSFLQSTYQIHMFTCKWRLEDVGQGSSATYVPARCLCYNLGEDAAYPKTQHNQSPERRSLCNHRRAVISGRVQQALNYTPHAFVTANWFPHASHFAGKPATRLPQWVGRSHAQTIAFGERRATQRPR